MMEFGVGSVGEYHQQGLERGISPERQRAATLHYRAGIAAFGEYMERVKGRIQSLGLPLFVYQAALTFARQVHGICRKYPDEMWVGLVGRAGAQWTVCGLSVEQVVRVADVCLDELGRSAGASELARVREVIEYEVARGNVGKAMKGRRDMDTAEVKVQSEDAAEVRSQKEEGRRQNEEGGEGKGQKPEANSQNEEQAVALRASEVAERVAEFLSARLEDPASAEGIARDVAFGLSVSGDTVAGVRHPCAVCARAELGGLGSGAGWGQSPALGAPQSGTVPACMSRAREVGKPASFPVRAGPGLPGAGQKVESGAMLGRFLFRWRGVIGGVAYVVLLVLGRPSLASCLYGLPLVVLALAVRFWASGYIGIEGRAREIGASHRIVSGPYRTLRHPLYIGNSLLVCGMLVALRPALWLGVMVLVGFFVEYMLIIGAEEKELADRRGQKSEGRRQSEEGGEVKGQKPEAKSQNGRAEEGRRQSEEGGEVKGQKPEAKSQNGRAEEGRRQKSEVPEAESGQADSRGQKSEVRRQRAEGPEAKGEGRLAVGDSFFFRRALGEWRTWVVTGVAFGLAVARALLR
jgi:hypothetical protein